MKIFVLTRKMDDFESTAVATPYLSLEAAQAAMTEDFKDILEVFGLTSRRRAGRGEAVGYRGKVGPHPLRHLLPLCRLEHPGT